MSTTKFECLEHVITGQHIRQYYRATATDQAEELQLCVKQYKPRQPAQPGDVTIIATPGNGLPKETYEPLWDELSKSLRRQNVRIRSIRIADYVNPAASAELNEGKVGTDPSLFDHARDYLALVNHFRKEMPPPLVGIGHSAGSAILAHLAMMHPRLLCSVSLIETNLGLSTRDPVMVGLGTIANRKDLWPSEDAAVAYLRQDRGYRNWQPRSIQLFRKYGLTKADPILFPQAAEGAVTLKTSRDQEVFTAFRQYFTTGDNDLPRYSHPDVDQASRVGDAAFYLPAFPIIGSGLPSLLPSCQYVYGRDNHTFNAPERVKNRKWRLQATGSGTGSSGGVELGKVVEVALDAGHCVPQEKPAELAALLAEWFGAQLREWREEQEREAQAWSRVEPKHRMDEEWKYQVQKSVKDCKAKVAKQKAKQGQKSRL